MASYVTGSIVGEFIVGDGTLVGTLAFVGDKPKLVLEPGRFQVYTSDVAPQSVKFTNHPQLILRPKVFDARIETRVLFGRPQLILRGKATNAVFFTPRYMQPPELILRSKLTALMISYDLTPGKPKLILTARLSDGHIPALSPTLPVDILLVPTEDEALLLTPTEERDLLLVPTVERFL